MPNRHISAPVGIDENGNIRWRRSFKGNLQKIFNRGMWSLNGSVKLKGILQDRNTGEFVSIELKNNKFVIV